MKGASDRGFQFNKRNVDSVRVVVLSEASFLSAPGMKSQLGLVVCMVDNLNRTNILHYGSSRYDRVSRSVIAAEVHTLVHAFDQAYMVHETPEELLGRQVPLWEFLDSPTLYNVIVKSREMAERRLPIDVCPLRKGYRRGELNRIGWIPENESEADVIAKRMITKNSAM